LIVTNALFRPRDAEKARNDELVSSVTQLVECMHRQASPGTGGIRNHRDAADRALMAATDAERRIVELRERIAQLEKLAMTDELTGLLNRRGFDTELQRTLALASRYEEPGLLVYVDLDGFKLVNDTYGHAAGDAVLRRVSRLLTDNLRCTDFVGRLGGDEFAVLLPRTTRKRGANRIQSLRRMLNPVVVLWKGATITVHASLGVQTYGGNDDADGAQLLSRADASMYQTKYVRARDNRLRMSA
jgi:diguanylate cyclase (GGDEF)-like protein